MQTLFTRRRAAFSLIELVIVVVIIGILAAIAVPRMSRGAAAASDSALSANLSVIRSAIELYQTEHGGSYPALADLEKALTQYTNAAGTSFGEKDVAEGRIFGPYLRTVPSLPVGANKGKTGFAATLGTTSGWVYDAATGTVRANCADSEVDARGVKYNTY
ncbi:MAG: prepilin-type N-terminal cleavage/methylation domain-containing protein [Phycisphaeraceae bacterium]|nr:prepilin-type N-terminal cleavage/methylation domain-containing protein [Phycisphaeraceae bacterium]